MLDDRVLIVIVSCACAEVVILRHDDETIHFSKAATGKEEAAPPLAAADGLAIVATGMILVNVLSLHIIQKNSFNVSSF